MSYRFLLLVMLAFVLAGCHDRQGIEAHYVKFEEVYFDNISGKFTHKPLERTDIQNLEIVLNEYNIPYKVDSGGDAILIRPKDFDDEELMWNFTSKMHDEAWLGLRKRSKRSPDAAKRNPGGKPAA